MIDHRQQRAPDRLGLRALERLKRIAAAEEVVVERMQRADSLSDGPRDAVPELLRRVAAAAVADHIGEAVHRPAQSPQLRFGGRVAWIVLRERRERREEL